MRSVVWLLVAMAAYGTARFSPPLDGLTPEGQAVLGVVLVGLILWVTESISLAATALVVIILLAVSPGMTLPRALYGFTSEIGFFLIGVTVISVAIEMSGLAKRASSFLVARASGSPTKLFVQMVVSLPVFAFVMPSAIARNAVMIPAYRDALTRMDVPQGGRAGRALMLALGMLNHLASSAFLTGGIASIAAATLLGGFTWLGWFRLMAPPYFLLIALGALYIRYFVGPFEVNTGSASPPPSSPFSKAELTTLGVLAGVAMLWLTDSIHHLHPAVPALIAAVALLSPVGVVTWKSVEQKLSWSLILTVGASISLAHTMSQCGAASWLGERIFGELSTLTTSPLLILIAMAVLSVVIHLGVMNLAACIAILIPITVTIAEAANLNPLVCGLVVTLAIDAVILYPVQTAANLIAYETGYFNRADVRRLGIAMLVFTILVVLIVLPYWSRLELPLRFSTSYYIED